MDRHDSTDEGTHIDQGVESDLQERVWQLRLGETTSYPERPGDPDCIYYLRTGFCGYGDRCRFNHPSDRSTSPVAGGGVRMSGGDFPERSGQPICQYYMRTGSCKYGTSCKYHHPRQGTGSVNSFGLNLYGYPMRPGEKECSYYMKMGQCKFGLTCKFHHPQPANVPMPTAVPPVPAAASAVYQIPSPAPQPYGVIPGDWSVMRPSMMPGSFQGPYGPMLLSHGVVPIPGWAPYPGRGTLAHRLRCCFVTERLRVQVLGAASSQNGKGRLAPTTSLWLDPSSDPRLAGTPSWTVLPFYGKLLKQCWSLCHVCQAPNPVATTTNPTAVGTGQLYGLTQLSPLAPAYTGSYQALSYANPSSSVLKESSFPQRPGQPECQYYLKTGECKFGSSCKYHHPAEWVTPESSSALSPMGLPLRPGTPTCSYYATHGVCKYGPACKFDHPMGTLSYSPSASSLSDMPVAPYPVGSLVGTLAASSSSSDLRAEAISGPTKDSTSTMTSSLSVSTGSGGSISSRSGSISQSGVQQSTQKAATSSSGVWNKLPSPNFGMGELGVPVVLPHFGLLLKLLRKSHSKMSTGRSSLPLHKTIT
ncbi:hypothetical protein KSS87_011530 [Heliosperma pusillum]|nr:hypothetical protein KSS87_011530 [Heliosperma pusillum]